MGYNPAKIIKSNMVKIGFIFSAGFITIKTAVAGTWDGLVTLVNDGFNATINIMSNVIAGNNISTVITFIILISIVMAVLDLRKPDSWIRRHF